MPVPQPKVLIVDDVEVNVRLLERIIAPAGVVSLVAQDPRQVVSLVKSFQPDLILLDLHMPVMDGFQVLERLRGVVREQDFLPVMVMTADSSTATRERALAAGAHDFLSTPYEPTEVLLRVRNLLRTRALHVSLKQHNGALEREVGRESVQRHARVDQSRKRTARINAVLHGDVLRMHYQPIVSLTDGSLLGVEALARFDAKPARAPHRWFAEAEQVGLGIELEAAAVRAAAQAVHDLPPGCFLAVNVSAAAVQSETGSAALAKIPPQRLVLELTEHVQVTDYEALAAATAALRAGGARLAVDDNGLGLANLRHIARLQPDIIKLSRDLIQGLDGDAAQQAQAAASVRFSREIAATVVAEGVETAAEVEVLCDLGVPAAQGYLFGRPQPLPLPRRESPVQGCPTPPPAVDEWP